MQKHEIHDLCVHVRSKLEELRFTNMTIGFSSFKSFPTACCKITSLAMMYYLSSMKGIPKRDLVLLANAEISNASDQRQLFLPSGDNQNFRINLNWNRLFETLLNQEISDGHRPTGKEIV